MTAESQSESMSRDSDDDCKDSDKSFLENLKECIGADDSGVDRRD